MRDGEKKLRTSIDEYNKFLKEVQQNLAEIDKNQELVAKLNQEVKSGKSIPEEIRIHIANIKALMENSRLKVLELDKSMNKLRKESEGKSEEILALEGQVKSLSKELLDKDVEIELLDNQFDEMEELYQMEAKYAAELNSIINRAYYISAGEKQLKSLSVLTKEGGFIGIGRVKMIKANSPDSVFTQIRKDEASVILLNTKKAIMISQHLEGSFELEKKGDLVEKLVIKDKTAFWKNGNYLVIQTEK